MGNIACKCRPCCPCCPPKSQTMGINRNRVFTSLYNYPPRTISDLNLKKGDVLEIMGESKHWFYVRRTKASDGSDSSNEEKGYVPRDFIKPMDSVEAEPWYFEMVKARIEAKRCLLRPENEEGAFLVWISDENKHYYLSVRNGPHARHYRIKQDEHDKQFFLVHHTAFQSLQSLIEFYSRNEGGLSVKLTKACVKLDQPVPQTLSYETEWEIDRSSLEKIKKLGSGEFADVWQGRWNNTTEVAIKEFKDATVNYSDIKSEIEIMKELRHERLLRLYAVCTTIKPICIITELMKNGSLKTFLISQDKMSCVRGIQRGERMAQPPGCPEALYGIMLLCWRANPEERPSFKELRELLMALIHEPVSELEDTVQICF
ncbi:hypothetical protein DNTS_016255 [Danionella cerebrum]|uniref:Tyrosine-protein kinase n=1 Tax=Danionella cerebrum TaxID=2873325 RepID=A0A553Q0T8_9TELE|nr:hypothetical protein DNTS_016255 [Danionella translucida]